MNDQLTKEAKIYARSFTGQVAWPTLALAFSVILGLVAILGLYANDLIAAPLAIFVSGLLTYGAYTPLHEAVHRNISGNLHEYHWINQLIGFLMGLIIAIPYTAHRAEHIAHHRHTNHEEKDPDFFTKDLMRSPIHLVLVGYSMLWNQVAFFVKSEWGKSSTGTKVFYMFELVCSFGWRAAFVTTTGMEGLAVLILGHFIGGFITIYLFSYLPHLPYASTERYKNTASFVFPKSLKWLEPICLGQNLHTIHHLFPWVPFYKYRDVYKKVEPTLVANETPIRSVTAPFFK